MKQLLLISIIFSAFVSSAGSAYAQEYKPDTLWHITMQPLQISAERTWENDTARYRYNQMKYYVTTVMPYVNAAVGVYQQFETKTNTGEISKKERKAFVKMKEAELKEQFDAEVKKLNETQAVLMIKLIARQTGVNIYDMLSEHKSPLTAAKWLGWGRLHGFNINKRYAPEDEPMLENIMESLDYPLPSLYYEKQILTAN